MNPQISARISAELLVIEESPVVVSLGSGATLAAPPLRCFLAAKHQQLIDADDWPTNLLYRQKGQFLIQQVVSK
jgi:hypothetical protein